jgi:transcriptional regulator with XRE-family HTH domain
VDRWEMIAATLVKRNREKAGLSQRALAVRSGVPQPVISRIESGREQPGLPLLGRILAGLRVEVTISDRLADHRVSAEEAARSVAQALAGGNTENAFRTCLEFADDLAAVTSIRLTELVGDRPALTGDSRYDALVAAISEDACERADIPVPAWVKEPERRVDRWYLTDIASLRELADEETPPVFRRHGVFILADELARA